MRGNEPTVGSLFSGIGGLDLGLERAGWEVKWQVEVDEWCRKILTKHWPDVPKYGDVRELSGDDLEPVDLIAGGPPCQPVSVAGRRKAQADPRWLWPEFLRIVSEVRPRLVLVENVPGLLHRGMAGVIGDLSACGYDAEWGCLSAADVGAPHLRQRVFIVGTQQSGPMADPSGRRRPQDNLQAGRDAAGGGGEVVAHTDRGGRFGRPGFFRQGRRTESEDGGAVADPTGRSGQPSSTQSNVGQLQEEILRSGGHTHDWTVEPDVGRVAHGVPARVDRLRGLGNAVVPQVAEWIGERLIETWK